MPELTPTIHNSSHSTNAATTMAAPQLLYALAHTAQVMVTPVQVYIHLLENSFLMVI